jgi:serpin B
MNRLFRAITATVPAVLFANCSDSHGPSPEDPITSLPRELTVAEQELIQADNTFALKLFREVNEHDPGKNVFISPLSVAMALGMTYNGAAGGTQQAMQEALELQGLTVEEINQSYRDLIDLLRNLDPGVEFTLANSIWYRNTMTFKQDFLDVNQQFFDAEVSALDFADPSAAQTINGWVNEKTNGKIPEIVPDPIPWHIVMYLINAIYFKGDWSYQFDKDQTHDAPFTLSNGSQTTVDMMSHGDEIEFGRNSDIGVQVADLRYGGEAFSMTILLPEAASDIDDLVQRLTQDNWESWIGGLSDGSMYLSMPKFTMEYEIELTDVLTALGMGEAFQPNVADFTGMCCQPGELYIDEVKHKTFVDVNEEGTEAAAATSVGIGLTSAPPSFVVDRPFLFVIREKLSGTILFMGKVLDPTAG